MVYPGGFDMGFLRGRTATHSGATREDDEAWEAWLKEHEAELPKPNALAQPRKASAEAGGSALNGGGK